MNEESKQDYGILIAKKSERLVTALYLVTDLIADEEPIKHSLRKNSVALLSSMNALSQHNAKDRFTEFKMSLKAVTEIISLLHVATTSSIVSEMNGKLLTDGFRALQLVLEKKQPILTKEMLEIDIVDVRLFVDRDQSQRRGREGKGEQDHGPEWRFERVHHCLLGC